MNCSLQTLRFKIQQYIFNMPVIRSEQLSASFSCRMKSVSIIFALFIILLNTSFSEVILEVNVTPDADADSLVNEVCRGRFPSCARLAAPSIQRLQANMLNFEVNWNYNQLCNCSLPPQVKVPYLQHLHIPKTGTSINWILHDYFDNCAVNETNPCSRHLVNLSSFSDGLCGGRLISCAGHRVEENLPNLAFNFKSNIVTMLRHPWNRLQSDYYYLKSKPHSQHLGPEINVTDVLTNTHNLYEFTAYPGISNCATKMLNGIQCGENAVLNDQHLQTAKDVLTAVLWFGITELFNSSICQFSWMYGGNPKPIHFLRFREGSYAYESFEESLSLYEQKQFKEREKFDLALYDFALELFKERHHTIQCPFVENIT